MKPKEEDYHYLSLLIFLGFFIFERYFYASSSLCSLACLIHVCNTSALLRVKSIFVIAIIPWCAELGLRVCLLWYNISKSTDVEPNSQHASKNQILFSFTSRHPRKGNRMNNMSEILSVANCLRMAFWPHWITATPSLDAAKTDGSSDSVNRAHGFSAVAELIPAGSTGLSVIKWPYITCTLHYVRVAECHTWGLHSAVGAKQQREERSLRCGAPPQLLTGRILEHNKRIMILLTHNLPASSDSWARLFVFNSTLGFVP